MHQPLSDATNHDTPDAVVAVRESAERRRRAAPPSQAVPSPPEAGTQPALLAACDALDRAAYARVAVATGGLSPASAWLAWADWALHMAVSPGKAVQLASFGWQSWLNALPRCLPGYAAAQASDATAVPLAQGKDDPRFADPGWEVWPFSAYRDAFAHAEAWCRQATTGVRGVRRRHERLVQFLTRQWLDALAPSNFVATNPRVLAAALSTGGASFAFGARNWAEDLLELLRYARGPEHKPEPDFLPGRDVAATPGKVVWRNELCELLQYGSMTAQAAREPVFIVPSWIMKYYILDLRQHDSLVRYLVDAGHTVFMVSWRNPDARARNLSLEDYLTQGLLAALEAVRARCGGERVQAVGYCLGGTLLAIAAAALGRETRLARHGRLDGPFASVTLLAAQTDFTEPGELGMFIDASELAALDALMWEQGYLDGSQMSAAFQLLNARDLIWSRMMSEYLLGRRSKPTDLMSWNADTTRMPHRMHSEYLRQLFLHNDLAEGRYCVAGRHIALADIDAPLFVVGTERDHVSPWRSVYKLNLLTHGDLTFVLTSGGHNAGIVSEPGHPGRHYRVATRPIHAPYRSPEVFVEHTDTTDGSWWPCWTAWLDAHATGQVPARALEDELPDAPGSYVFET